jgi:bacillithiol system protein YtxJ
MNWNKLGSLAELDELIANSETKTQVIFKHSTTCSISAMALSRFERNFQETALEQADFNYLDLKVFREVSNAIASKLLVVHESPQVIIIKNGSAIFNASHYEISFADVVGNLA